MWDINLAQCVYRKCANECPSVEEDRERIFGGDSVEDVSSSEGKGRLNLLGRLPTPIFNRTSYCCSTNLCNYAEKSAVKIGFGLLAMLTTLITIAVYV